MSNSLHLLLKAQYPSPRQRLVLFFPRSPQLRPGSAAVPMQGGGTEGTCGHRASPSPLVLGLKRAFPPHSLFHPLPHLNPTAG